MSDQFPRWDDPASDNLKLEYMRRAWGDAPPDFVTYDVTGTPRTKLAEAAKDIERMFFGDAQPPYGRIVVTYWVRPAHDHLMLTVSLPRLVPMAIDIDEHQHRLVSYGKKTHDRDRGVGLDGVTVHTVNFRHIWAPQKAMAETPPQSRELQNRPATVQAHMVISTQPEPPRQRAAPSRASPDVAEESGFRGAMPRWLRPLMFPS